MQPLARLRLQLTAWYAGVFTLVLALLGGGLFLTIRHQMSWHLDTSLRAAAAALERAARIREAERASARGAVVDAVDELHIPDRSLYLLDADGQPIKPTPMADWIRDAVRRAASSGHGYRNLEAPDDHELRTPITILRTRAEVGLAQEREPARDRAMLEAIARETARLGGLAGDLLTLARADAGERPIARESLYLDDAAAGAVDAVRALAQHKTVAVDVGTFEEARIIGDPALVRQLLLIVLDNAIKFTPAGGRVRLDVATVDGRAAVVVTDTGIGIPAAQLPHVFERFYRGDKARRETEGAGPGLPIAPSIAAADGARIDIGPAPGGGAGTRVTISFPVSPDLSPKERS